MTAITVLPDGGVSIGAAASAFGITAVIARTRGCRIGVPNGPELIVNGSFTGSGTPWLSLPYLAT